MESETVSTSKVTNLDASITEMNLTVQYSFHSSDRLGRGRSAIYSVASYRDYVSQEVRPAMLVSTQLIRYSLDTCFRYSTYFVIFKSRKGSIVALSFLIP
jgi:hypothetical protein